MVVEKNLRCLKGSIISKSRVDSRAGSNLAFITREPGMDPKKAG